MPRPFKCPLCGGPLEYDGGDTTVRCEFCSNSVIVPEELRESFEPARVAVHPKFPLLKLAADRKGIVYIVQRGDINRYDGMTGQTLGKVQTDGKSFDDVVVTLDGGLIAVQNNEDLVRFDTNGRYLDMLKIERNVAFGMVFNDKNELFVAAPTQIVKFALNK